MDIVEKARVFATAAHAAAGNRDRYTGMPYIGHPEAVMRLVASVPHTPEMLAAALLHDTIEDTHVDQALIEHEFGREVAELVNMLTDVSKPEDGNRAARKALDRLHSAQAKPAAKTIKLADLINNSMTIVAKDPAFARAYMVEKELLLEVLREGDPTLYGIARGLIERYKAGTLA